MNLIEGILLYLLFIFHMVFHTSHFKTHFLKLRIKNSWSAKCECKSHPCHSAILSSHCVFHLLLSCSSPIHSSLVSHCCFIFLTIAHVLIAIRRKINNAHSLLLFELAPAPLGWELDCSSQTDGSLKARQQQGATKSSSPVGKKNWT